MGAGADESDLSADISLFEAAVHAQHVELSRPALEVVLVVPDGSNQDDTARAMAAAVARRTGAQVCEQAGAQSAAEILGLCADKKAGMLILPVPFGRDIGTLKDESLGSVVDMLLLEAACPVLCVREVLTGEQLTTGLTEIVLPVFAADEAATRAAGWALRLLEQGGQLHLLAVGDRDVIAEASKLLGGAEEISPQAEAISQALSQQAAGLIAAVQKQGSSAGLDVHVEAKVGHAVQVVLQEANLALRLIVVGTPKDHTAPAFHHATDLILGARGPVLVV